MKDKKIPKTIPGIIKIIKESNDTNTIETMENYIACFYGVPTLFLGAIINYMLNHTMKDAIINSIVMLVFSFCFMFTLKLNVRTRIITHWLSILLSAELIFVAIREYSFIGPAIWTIVFINVIIASTRMTRIMLNYITVSTLFVGMYYSLVLSKTSFEITVNYCVIQTTLFILIIIMAPVVHLVNKAHYSKINTMYMTEVNQREEIEVMYENMARTHTELRVQYNELNEKNIKLKTNEEKLYYIAHFDVLTELPNRKSIIDKMNTLIEQSKKEIVPFYIVFIDMDSFKKINDTMGHHIGDLLIKKVANRLSKNMVHNDMIGRIGADEFALIIPRNISKDEAFHYLEQLRKELLKPFVIEKKQIKTSASFGVAQFQNDGVEQIELMSHADTAMYKAKEYGKNNIQFFDSSMKKELLDKVNFETEIISALHNEEFYLVFQPIFNLKEHKIRGVEVLVRWNSKKLGFVSPDQFIPIAEELGMIVPLGEWILKTACKKFKQLLNKYNMDIILSINLSVKQLESPNIVEVIQKALREAELDPKYLEIEVTESLLMNSIEENIKIMEKLRAMNISISLDDFGTGYSSLNYLRKLPIDILKIDKTFIDALLIEHKNKHIIGTIITLAHNLGISVVAEGIEEKIQVSHLKQLSCDYIQGYYISKPLMECDLEQFIKKNVI